MEQVEQICEDICLIASGSALVSGSLRDVKRAAGRNVVEIEFEGSDGFVADLESNGNIEVLSSTIGMVRLRLNNRTLADEVLDRARRDVSIFRFELVEPSLNEIFIDQVGAHTVSRTAEPEML